MEDPIVIEGCCVLVAVEDTIVLEALVVVGFRVLDTIVDSVVGFWLLDRVENSVDFWLLVRVEDSMDGRLVLV